MLFEKFSLIWTSLNAQANRPLSKAVAVHSKEYSNIVESVKKCITSYEVDLSILDKLESIEINIDESWQKVDNAEDLNIEFSWMDHFKNRQNRKMQIRERWDSVLTQNIETNMDVLSVNLRKNVEAAFNRIYSVLSGEFEKIIKILENAVQRKEFAYSERSARSDSQLQMLNQSLFAFENIKKMLY